MTNAEDFISFDFWKQHTDNFDAYLKPLAAHFEANRDKFWPVNTHGHRVSVCDEYNSYLEGKLVDYMIPHLMRDLHSGYLIMLHVLDKDATEKGYKKFIDYLNNGYVPLEPKEAYFTNTQRYGSQSYDTGKDVKLFFDVPYMPYPASLNMIDGKYKWLELDDTQKPGVAHIELDCPSGTLIAADWIRIKEFTDATRSNDEYLPANNINCVQGRINNAIRQASKLNMLDICLGNTTVEIYKKGNNLVFGDSYSYNRDTDKEVIKKPAGFRNKGSICTDRWSLNLIDRKHLEDLLSSQGVSDPVGAVDKYLNDDKCSYVNVLKVDPGKYHVYFSGEYYDFAKQFNPSNFDKTEGFKYYVVISDKELSFDSELAAEGPGL